MPEADHTADMPEADGTSRQDLTLPELANRVAKNLEADVILYNGPIERPAGTQFIDACINRHRRKNALLILVTPGGEAGPAYRIARCLQSKYERLIIYVSGYCKSAGTIVALGAHELVISDHGELGPLDVQMSKKDELLETQSGLTVMDTLSALKDNALDAFEKFFLDFVRKSDGAITLKTAAQMAAEMTTGLFTPLYAQVDPLHIGEAGRAMSIAGHYGKRLLNQSGNISPTALDFIMSEYPSHGFVIDRQEAEQLFENVREPSDLESLLASKLGDRALTPGHFHMHEGRSPFSFLSEELPETERPDSKDDKDARPREPEGTGLESAAEEPLGQPARSNGHRENVSAVDIDA